MIITIDGPAGAGKSSAARQLAERLGFRFLDTGAMYRAVTYVAVRDGIDLTDPDALLQVAEGLDLELRDQRVHVRGEDVTEAIRKPELTALIRYAADHPGIRQRLVTLQRHYAAQGNFVTEGRDQGTVVFPDAECKFFLTASPETRARRRLGELRRRGAELTYEQVLEAQIVRDRQDESRPVGRLVPAPDAIIISTDGMEPHEVVETLERIVRERLLTAEPRQPARPGADSSPR